MMFAKGSTLSFVAIGVSACDLEHDVVLSELL